MTTAIVGAVGAIVMLMLYGFAHTFITRRTVRDISDEKGWTYVWCWSEALGDAATVLLWDLREPWTIRLRLKAIHTLSVDALNAVLSGQKCPPGSTIILYRKRLLIHLDGAGWVIIDAKDVRRFLNALPIPEDSPELVDEFLNRL